eukprot:CAMPEP_0168411722 /NCGR_PEP_ID=MMETSP0228-20121227/28344_1 /TAXON_ID=133427 /ORGANISM="Protoceratium reticulatum, Strain CCCM 535 (=CCMP 1889)" /LENGTH=48 /DNA_ID= /DNA_START= /DNA_END= /DNA_ORIENTATION=
MRVLLWKILTWQGQLDFLSSSAQADAEEACTIAPTTSLLPSSPPSCPA